MVIGVKQSCLKSATLHSSNKMLGLLNQGNLHFYIVIYNRIVSAPLCNRDDSKQLKASFL